MDRTDVKWAALITAIAAGTAGVAEGARELLKGGDIKDGSLEAKELSAKARKALKGRRGPRGLQGLQGPAGIAGAAGAAGKDGINGAAGAAGNSLFTTATSFGYSNGSFLGVFPANQNLSGTESDVQFPAPAGMTKAVGLAVRAGSVTTLTFTLRVNAQPTSIACQVSPNQTCTATGSVAVAPTDALSIGITGGGKTAGAVAVLSFGP